MFFTLAFDRGERLASCPGHFMPGEGFPSTCLIGDQMGPRVKLDAIAENISEF
jgi:hypothetical protein